jgi:8-oxo-dGTP pyrophosphatase MutT (NUDIX family)
MTITPTTIELSHNPIDPILVVTAAIVDTDAKRLFVQRRSGKTSYPWHWCTPGGKKRDHEMDWQTLRRELSEEHKMWFAGAKDVGRLVYECELPLPFTDGTMIVSCYFLAHTDIRPIIGPYSANAEAVAGFDWVTANELETLQLAPADHANRGKLMELIR